MADSLSAPASTRAAETLPSGPPAPRSWIALGHRRRRGRGGHRHDGPRAGQRQSGPARLAGVPGRLDRRAVRVERDPGLVAAAGEPPRTVDAGHRVRDGGDGPAVVRTAGAGQHRASAGHAAGGDVPARVPGLPDRTADPQTRAGRGHRLLCRGARPAVAQDHPGGQSGRTCSRSPRRLDCRQPRRGHPAEPGRRAAAGRDGPAVPAQPGQRPAAPSADVAAGRRVRAVPGHAGSALCGRPWARGRRSRRSG